MIFSYSIHLKLLLDEASVRGGVLTMWSDAVGRYTMNSDKALTFDKKITFTKKSALPTVSWTTLGAT